MELKFNTRWEEEKLKIYNNFRNGVELVDKRLKQLLIHLRENGSYIWYVS